MRVWVVGFVLLTAIASTSVWLWISWDSSQPAPGTLASASGDGEGDPRALDADGGGTGVGTDAGVGALSRGPAGPVATTTTTTTLPDTACVPSDRDVVGDPVAEWATVVVDTAHRLPADFEPPDLVDIGLAGFANDGGDRVRELVLPDLAALRQAAEANGTPIMVVSAYRSYQYQQNLFDQSVATEGPDAAAATTARPGHSEHQLGTTIDVLDPASSELTAAFGDTPPGRWVTEHAHEFGFVQSYPNEGRDQTCYDFEPWHLRYVGRDVAAQIHASGLTPRAWMLRQQERDA